jgi:PncC family amidohydrolase
MARAARQASFPVGNLMGNLMDNLKQLAEAVVREAQACGLTIATAESCTAGRLAALLSDAPGAAQQFHGGFVTYTKPMKTAVLGVPSELLARRGAVCEEVALAMAEGALRRTPADLAVAVTGVAGPEPDEDGNPVGLVYCAVMRRHAAGQAVRLPLPDMPKARILEAAMRRALELLRESCAREAA